MSPIAKKSPTVVDKHVGGRVRARRQQLKMSQSTLARAVGLTFQQIQKYEKGANRIGAGRLQQIAHELQAPLSYFFDSSTHFGAPTHAENAATPADPYSLLTDPEGAILIKAMTQIKDLKIRRSIVKLVETIADSQ